jgi:hypothetical protein
MSDKLPAFTVEQRDQVKKLSSIGAFEIVFENEEIVVYAMCEPKDDEEAAPFSESTQTRIFEEVVRANLLEVITNAANELVDNAEGRGEARGKLFAISGYLRELAGLAEKAAAKMGHGHISISTKTVR